MTLDITTPGHDEMLKLIEQIPVGDVLTLSFNEGKTVTKWRRIC
jgi:hypothetical protein